MVHLCMIKSVVMWLHILVVSLLLCVCRTVPRQLPKDGVTAPKYVGAILM